MNGKGDVLLGFFQYGALKLIGGMAGMLIFLTTIESPLTEVET